MPAVVPLAPCPGWRAGAVRCSHPNVDVGTGYVVLRKEASYLDGHCRLCGAKMDRKINEHPAADNPNASVKVLEQRRFWGLQLLFLESCHASNPAMIHSSIRRWLGAGLLGLVCGGHSAQLCEYTIPQTQQSRKLLMQSVLVARQMIPPNHIGWWVSSISCIRKHCLFSYNKFTSLVFVSGQGPQTF